MSDRLETKPELVLCVPGPWRTHSDLVESIATKSGGFLFAGKVMINLETQAIFRLEHQVADPRVTTSFRAAGPHWKDTPEMEAIGGHASVVYVVCDGGSRVAAEASMDAGAALLRAGGFGVKVESTGLSHSPRAWLQFTHDRELFAAHRAFVVYLTGDECASCGMHNFGLPDAIVRGLNKQAASELLRAFTWYLFTESPTIESGQTFSSSAEAPVFRIESAASIDYGPGSLFNNPYGTWRLVSKTSH